MPVSDEFVDFVLDQMERLGSVYPRKMFGGVGLYLEDLFFGLIAEDVLYLKVDDATRKRFETAGAKPFRPYGEGSYSMSYYEVPVSVLEDRDKLKTWAAEAVAVAARKAAAKTEPRKKRIHKR